MARELWRRFLGHCSETTRTTGHRAAYTHPSTPTTSVHETAAAAAPSRAHRAGSSRYELLRGSSVAFNPLTGGSYPVSCRFPARPPPVLLAQSWTV